MLKLFEGFWRFGWGTKSGLRQCWEAFVHKVAKMHPLSVECVKLNICAACSVVCIQQHTFYLNTTFFLYVTYGTVDWTRPATHTRERARIHTHTRECTYPHAHALSSASRQHISIMQWTNNIRALQNWRPFINMYRLIRGHFWITRDKLYLCAMAYRRIRH